MEIETFYNNINNMSSLEFNSFIKRLRQILNNKLQNRKNGRENRKNRRENRKKREREQDREQKKQKRAQKKQAREQERVQKNQGNPFNSADDLFTELLTKQKILPKLIQSKFNCRHAEFHINNEWCLKNFEDFLIFLKQPVLILLKSG